MDDADSSGKYPKTLEGCKLRLDFHKPKNRPAYERLTMRCTKHPNCRKFRSTLHPDTAHLGPRAALAYLAVWFQGGRPDQTAKQHSNDVKPTEEQMRNWLEAH